MILPPDALPFPSKSLQDLVREQARKIAEQETCIRTQQGELIARDEQITSLTRRAEILQEQLNLAIARRYAARSEKNPLGPGQLFDEAECAACFPEAPESPAEALEAAVTVPAHTRKKAGRKPLPAALPRVDIVYELPENERFCPQDGQALTVIGQEVSEQLDIIPATIRVKRHVRLKYGACPNGCCVKTAPFPKQPIPKSMASPGLLAHIAVSKYQDALPLYRQEAILQRIGVELPRATLASWMIKVGTLVQPLINLLRDTLLSYDYVAMDETRVQVLKESGKSAESQSFLWVQRGGPPGQPILLFEYDPGRSAEVPLRLLAGFKGILQTDGYSGYSEAVRTQGLTHAGCVAHLRRKFVDAIKAQGKHRKPGLAEAGLRQIEKLYAIEKAARPLTPEARLAYRAEHAQPLWAALRTWLDTYRPTVPPQATLGKALTYLDNEWEKFRVYLTDGRVPIDNNKTENAIRPFCVGRRNWLFADSVAGVKASANLYSLMETCKAIGLEPYDYLRHLFTKLPQAETLADLEALLPHALMTDPTLARFTPRGA